MKRELYTQLIKWKDSAIRKPLLLQGARQVGKSYLLERFGKNEFPNFFLFNFEQTPQLAKIFQADLVPKRIIRELSLVVGKTIIPEKDLVIFDEIQECPKALTSLKYFNEEMSELALCCAGSLLGVKLSSESFPVGKVNFLHLYPMTFREFLQTLGKPKLIESLADIANPLPEIAHDMLWKLLMEYFITGGLPQIVKEYVPLRNTPVEARKNTRKLQQELLASYYKDFAKHAGATNSVHIVAVLENIPMQLVHNQNGSVKRYIFKDVIPGKKSFADLQCPIDWLEQAGLAIKVKVCNRSELPLESFCKPNMFKLFVFDVGLLGCMLNLPVEAIADENYGITKGYFAENFVAQELMAADAQRLYSWTERNSQIEFLINQGSKIIPLEVKAGIRTQAKSLQQYIQKYSPEEAIILSRKNTDWKKDSVVKYVPLYMAGSL
ncbi:AAA family ATPase [Candidatus Parabeggiatoa sp. HSG14]|uniref:ATP-binding protein n=1 Tax=Candidatus Parabeggiatoa sp. HSG14 TaxID=3055593 RepID=UPI0025A837F1|nr:AAA family ATPase [Thiotrichales bacterium HSG14]